MSLQNDVGQETYTGAREIERPIRRGACATSVMFDAIRGQVGLVHRVRRAGLRDARHASGDDVVVAITFGHGQLTAASGLTARTRVR